jgi:hypothetical protein
VEPRREASFIGNHAALNFDEPQARRYDFRGHIPDLSEESAQQEWRSQMSRHDYSPQQALELLMQKLNQRDETLADRMRSALNSGKDVLETESYGRGSKKQLPIATRFRIRPRKGCKSHFMD